MKSVHNKVDSRSRFTMTKDSRGSITMSIPIVTLISLFMLLIALTPYVMSYGALDNRVKNMEDYFAEAGPRHTETINNINGRLNEMDKVSTTNKVLLTTIKDDISEIKQDIKEVKNKIDQSD